MDDDDLSSSEVRLSCATCGEEIARTTYWPFSWVHVNDFIHLPQMGTDYDHEPALDVLDVPSVEVGEDSTVHPEEPPASRRSQIRSNTNPFEPW